MNKIEIISGWGVVRSKPAIRDGYPEKAWYLSHFTAGGSSWCQNRNLCSVFLSKAIAETYAKNLGLSSKEFSIIEIDRPISYRDPFSVQT